MVGKNYGDSSNVESGGFVTLLIYLLIISCSLIFIRNWKDNNMFSIVLIAILGLVLYSFRYFSFQIFERMSYYFFFMLLILLPNFINKIRGKERILAKIIVVLICLLLFAYRLNGSLFENFTFL